MKKLSDYQGDEALLLWGDLLTPILTIYSDESIKEAMAKSKNLAEKAKIIIKSHATETSEMLLRIDPTPLTGLNVVVRLVELLLEIEHSEELAGFFGFATKTDDGFSGSVMANTEADGK